MTATGLTCVICYAMLCYAMLCHAPRTRHSSLCVTPVLSIRRCDTARARPGPGKNSSLSQMCSEFATVDELIVHLQAL
jgi:hypothetical protein